MGWILLSSERPQYHDTFFEGFSTLIVGKGGKDEVNSTGWDGLIDELRIYGRALSAEEVMWLAGRTDSVHKPL